MFIKLSRLIILFLICFMAFSNFIPVHAQVNAEAVDMTFKDLGYSDMRLRGLYGTNSVWIPFQPDWPVGDVEIELTYTASPLLNSEEAILSVLANNQEITSIRPIGDGQEHTLAFLVPPALQLPTGINLTFDGHLRLTNEFCEDSFNTGQWLIVRNSSRIRFNLSDTSPAPELSDLPSAIVVQGQYDYIPPVVFVLPDQPDDLTLTAAAQVATRLGMDITSKNLPLSIATAASLTNQQRQNANLVVIGLPGNQPLIAELSDRMPVPPTSEGFVSQDGILIPATDGVVQIFNSPWMGRRNILLVSGNDSVGLTMASQAFAHDATFQSLAGSFNFIHSLVDRPESALGSPWLTDQTTFAQLGEFDRQVTGLGITDTYYFFQYPPGVALDQGSQLVLHIAFSPALRNENSYAVVYVNDIYTGAVNVNATDGDARVALELPTQALNQLARKNHAQGLNVRLSIANLLPANNCEQVNKDSSWTKIYADSYFQTDFVPVELPDLYFFPYPFAGLRNNNSVQIVLPDDPTGTELNATLSVAALLGKSSISDLTVDVKRASAENLESLARSELILIGTPDRHPWIREALTGVQTTVPVDVYQVLAAPQTGFFHALTSPWNKKMNILAIYGDTDEGLRAATDTLYQHGQLVQESGSIALVRSGKDPVVIYREVGLPTPEVLHPDVVLSENGQQGGQAVQATPVADMTTNGNTPSSDNSDTASLSSTERLILIITVFLVILVAAGALVRVAWRIRA